LHLYCILSSKYDLKISLLGFQKTKINYCIILLRVLMKFSEVLRFSARLISVKKGRSTLVMLSVAVSIAILTLFSAFGRGVQHLLLDPISAESDARTLIVFRKNPDDGIFSFGKTGLNTESVAEFRAIPGVEKVSPQMPLIFPSSIVIPLGLDFQIDMFFSGVETDDLETIPIPPDTIPIFVNPQILDLYNSSFAEMIPGISRVDSETILGRKIKIEFGKTSFLPDVAGLLGTKNIISKTGIIAGVSSKVPVFGFSIPLPLAEEISEEVLGKEVKPLFSRVFVVGKDDVTTTQIKRALEKKGFLVRDFSESTGGKIREMTIGFRATLAVLGFAIFAIALFSLLAIVSVSLSENQKTIGILRSFGARKRDIFRIFFGEVFLLAGTGIVSGVLLAIAFGVFCNLVFQKSVALFSFAGKDLFDFSGFFIGEIFCGALFAALFFAFFPIRRAVQKDILNALWD